MTKRSPRILSYSLAASLLVSGLLAGGGTAANADTSPAAPRAGTPAAAAQAAAIAENFLKHLMTGRHATDQTAGSMQTIDGQTHVQSNNWAGYADTGSGFRKVSGSWTEPSGNCGLDMQSLAAFWVGIDGFKSSSVEQDGTLVECNLGTEYHYTWWEMYPSNSVQMVGSTVAAGDHITSSVTRSGSNYTLRVIDHTHPSNSFSTTQTCSSGCANSSAEWVAESPSGGFLGNYPLADFGTWNATGSAATGSSGSGSITSFKDNQVTMTGSLGDTMATPSGLSNGGRDFSVTWNSSS